MRQWTGHPHSSRLSRQHEVPNTYILHKIYGCLTELVKGTVECFVKSKTVPAKFLKIFIVTSIIDQAMNTTWNATSVNFGSRISLLSKETTNETTLQVNLKLN